MVYREIINIEIPDGYKINYLNHIISDNLGFMLIKLSKEETPVGEMYVNLINKKPIAGKGKVIYVNEEHVYKLNDDNKII